MTKHIMKNVRLRKVVELLHLSDDHSRREPALRQALEEQLRFKESAHRHCAPTRKWFKATIHIFEIWNASLLQPDALDSFYEDSASRFAQLPHAAVKKQQPYLMLLSCVFFPALFDECCGFVRDGFYHFVSQKETARDFSRAVCV